MDDIVWAFMPVVAVVVILYCMMKIYGDQWAYALLWWELSHKLEVIMKKYRVDNRRKVALAQREKDLKVWLNESGPDEIKKYKRIKDEVAVLKGRIKI